MLAPRFGLYFLCLLLFAAAVVLVLILYFLFRPDPAKQLQRRAAAANA